MAPRSTHSDTDASDIQLAARVREGDSAAFEALLRRYWPLVTGIPDTFYAPGHDRDDLRQAALIGLYNAAVRYREDAGPFPAFARLCIRRRVITEIIAARRHKHLPLNSATPLSAKRLQDEDDDAADAGALIPNAQSPDPEEAVLAAETVGEIASAAASRLTDLEARVLAGWLEGLSYGELSARIGRQTKAIDNAIQRVRRKLRPLLDTAG
jgi:RNA polymerase sporulation-specific sigma factor